LDKDSAETIPEMIPEIPLPSTHQHTDYLSSHIIESLGSEFDVISGDAAVLYFYIDGSENRPFSFNALYETLIYQLAHQTTGSLFLFRQRTRHPESDEARSMQELRRSYNHLARNFNKIYIVIDALDESQEVSTDLDDLLVRISSLAEQTTSRTNVLISSRPLEQLRRSGQRSTALQITMKGDEILADMSKLLQSRLKSAAPFRRWPQTLRSSVETTLLSKAGGS
jgi:hypothetical protein